MPKWNISQTIFVMSHAIEISQWSKSYHTMFECIRLECNFSNWVNQFLNKIWSYSSIFNHSEPNLSMIRWNDKFILLPTVNLIKIFIKKKKLWGSSSKFVNVWSWQFIARTHSFFYRRSVIQVNVHMFHIINECVKLVSQQRYSSGST